MRRGFTLLEVLISLTVFSVGMMAIVTLASQTQLLTRAGSVRTRAALLAQEGLESAIARGFSGLTAGQLYMNDANLGALGDTYQYYSREVAIYNVTSNLAITDTDTGMKLVTATVRWDERSGDSSKGAKEFVASTIVTDL